MMLKRLLHRDEKGIGAAEFALIAPVLITFIISVSQMGKLFFANADMKNALADGARVASVWPVPDDATILAAINTRLTRAEAATRAVPSVARGTENGNPYIKVSMTYTVPLEFIFFDVPAVRLTDSRTVYTQVTNANSTTYTTPSSTTTSATSASSSGNASSTSSTSTSATSASSTSTTSTSSTSSGNNGSSGQSHEHGNCKKKC